MQYYVCGDGHEKNRRKSLQKCRKNGNRCDVFDCADLKKKGIGNNVNVK